MNNLFTMLFFIRGQITRLKIFFVEIIPGQEEKNKNSFSYKLHGLSQIS